MGQPLGVHRLTFRAVAHSRTGRFLRTAGSEKVFMYNRTRHPRSERTGAGSQRVVQICIRTEAVQRPCLARIAWPISQSHWRFASCGALWARPVFAVFHGTADLTVRLRARRRARRRGRRRALRPARRDLAHRVADLQRRPPSPQVMHRNLLQTINLQSDTLDYRLGSCKSTCMSGGTENWLQRLRRPLPGPSHRPMPLQISVQIR